MRNIDPEIIAFRDRRDHVLFPSLVRKSPVRKWLLMNPDFGSQSAADDLLDLLSSSQRINWREKIIACRVLSNLELDRQQRTVALGICKQNLADRTDKDDWPIRIGHAVMRSWLPALVALVVSFPFALKATEESKSDMPMAIWGPFLLAPLVSSLIATILFVTTAIRQKHAFLVKIAAVDAAASLGGAKALMLLARQLRSNPAGRFGNAIERGLLKVIPTINTSMSGRLRDVVIDRLSELTEASNEALSHAARELRNALILQVTESNSGSPRDFPTDRSASTDVAMNSNWLGQKFASDQIGGPVRSTAAILDAIEDRGTIADLESVQLLRELGSRTLSDRDRQRAVDVLRLRIYGSADSAVTKNLFAESLGTAYIIGALAAAALATVRAVQICFQSKHYGDTSLSSALLELIFIPVQIGFLTPFIAILILPLCFVRNHYVSARQRRMAGKAAVELLNNLQCAD